MLYSCTRTATVGVKGLALRQVVQTHSCVMISSFAWTLGINSTLSKYLDGLARFYAERVHQLENLFVVLRARVK